MALPSRTPLALLSALACLASACGSDDEPAIEEPTVASILASPDDFDEVRLEGAASPLGRKGFVLDDETASIVVLGFPTASLKVDEEPVVVIGRVRALEAFHVDNVRDEVARGGSEIGETRVAALEKAPFRPGAPYLELINVRNEDGS